ncbi:MAG: DUF1800 family protein [Deltaproteobacteria bacterium]|nr:DUF1800 family protein [Deltaproteobacteria bacterium]
MGFNSYAPSGRRALSLLLLSILYLSNLPLARAVDWVPVDPSSVYTVSDPNFGTITCATVKNKRVSGRAVSDTRFLPLSVSVNKLQKKARKAYGKKARSLKKKASNLKKRMKAENIVCEQGPPVFTPTPTPPPSSDAVSLEKLDRAVEAEDVRYLHEKAGFGYSAREQWLASTAVGGTIDTLVDTYMSTRSEDSGLMEKVNDMVDGSIGEDDSHTQYGQRQALFELWTHTNNPYAERLALFLLGVWTVSGEAVDDGVFRKMFWDYYQRLRNYSYLDTNLTELGVEITRDPFMLVYLNNELNIKGAPNENYARELMELFTLGTEDLDGNPNYTETKPDGSGDIAVAARMLTGWWVQRDWWDLLLETRYSAARHADGPHIMFAGTPYQFTGENDEDLVRGIFANHPQVKNYYAKELLQEYLTPNPPRELIESFGRTIAENNYKLRPAMNVLLKSKAFYHPFYKDTLPKNSIEFAVESVKVLGLENAYNVESTDWHLLYMAMQVNDSPSVFWFSPNAWTSAALALERANFVTNLIRDTDAQQLPEPDWLPQQILPAGEANTRQVIEHIAAALGIDSVPEPVFQALEAYMNRERQWNGSFINQNYNNTNAILQRRKGLGVYSILMTSPSYQLK